MIANILPADPTPLTLGSKGQNSTFSEHGHVAHKIKWNREGSNMVANVLPADPSHPPYGSKGHNSTFSDQRHVANYRESRMQQHSSKYFARRPPRPWGSKVPN